MDEFPAFVPVSVFISTLFRLYYFISGSWFFFVIFLFFLVLSLCLSDSTNQLSLLACYFDWKTRFTMHGSLPNTSHSLLPIGLSILGNCLFILWYQYEHEIAHLATSNFVGSPICTSQFLVFQAKNIDALVFWVNCIQMHTHVERERERASERVNEREILGLVDEK